MVKWTDELEKRFLMAIITTSKCTPNFGEAASLMGPGFTFEGLKTKYNKGIRRQAYARFEDDGDAMKTPTKCAGTKSTKSGSSKRKAAKDVEEDDDGDDDKGTPSKKIKVKQEAAAEESDGDLV